MTTQYQNALAALQRKAPLAEMRNLLRALCSVDGINAGINEVDRFGLTISMRAAAHGRLNVVKAAHDLGARTEQTNPLTGANILHYAAQQPLGGAEIIRWAVGETSIPYLQQQILMSGDKREKDEDKYWDRGNGHTVAFEAVFNNNVPAVQALLALQKEGRSVDIETPAVHGLRPLVWALMKSKNLDIINILRPARHPQSSSEEAEKEEGRLTEEYVQAKDGKWREGLSDQRRTEDEAGLDLADKLREYIIDGSSGTLLHILDQAGDFDPNNAYGRFGQPLLILVPTHPRIMSIPEPPQDQKDRYTEVVGALIDRGANPRIKEKGLMEVSAGFREVFFGYMDALERMIESIQEPEREDFVNEVGFFNGYTRLIDAGLIGNAEAIQLLLDYGADQSIRGFNGWTAADAARGGNRATAVLTE